ncbi:MAG TPA: alpha/beta hydrolase [Mycobacteriales bacterium]|nr:alpha/beta hydrolase [Mycobacteriales bacterium]
MANRRTVGLTALAVGAAGAAVAAGVAAERRAIGRARSAPDPHADEPFGKLHTEGLNVVTDDGVALHVEVDGNPDAPLTVVFLHGFTLSMDAFHFQRRDLGDAARLVFYDHRSHGDSERSHASRCTIDQLGKDLDTVLQAVAPAGPVVLVGHSMGGMTILSLADQRPDLFGERIVGVALLSTSTGNLAKEIVGVPGVVSRLINPLVPSGAKLVHRRASAIERGRRVGSDVGFLITRFLSFGPGAPPSLIAFMEEMLLDTSVEVMAEFFDTFLSHDKLTALGVLSDVPVLISCGSRDVLTPLSHSQVMADRLPSAEFQILTGANHMAKLERPDEVNAALRRLFERAAEHAAIK